MIIKAIMAVTKTNDFIINSVDKAKSSCVTPYRCSTTVFVGLVETYPLYSKLKKLTITVFPTYDVSF